MADRAIQVFKRVEKKYLLSAEEYFFLMDTLLLHMAKDQYGRHSICNIYYDNESNELIRTSIQKPVYKEKLRLRSYGIPKAFCEEKNVFLEIKKKCAGVVYKRRIHIKFQDVERILDDKMDLPDYILESYDDTQIAKEIRYIVRHYNVRPDRFIAYDRIALFGIEDEGLRITFDGNIRTRKNDLDLSAGDHGSLLLDEDHYLMEIKTNGAMPTWLVKELSFMEIYPFSFSKYGKAYNNQVMEDMGGTSNDK